VRLGRLSMGVGEMMYFPDRSPYSYLAEAPEDNAFNIGWLDRTVPYQTGDVPADFVVALKDVCRSGVNRTRGLHQCNLCPADQGTTWPPSPTTIRGSTGDYVVGGAEIRVNGRDGIVFASPDMIIHYVEAHGYRPPEEFIEAVLASRHS
jgi:hypothetical protein